MPTTTGGLRPLQPTPMHARDTEPTWWRSSVLYQVHPRSFRDGDGDLAGITAVLGQLAELDIDAIWLSPSAPPPSWTAATTCAPTATSPLPSATPEDFDALVAAPHSQPGGRTGSVRDRAPGRSSKPATTVSDS